MNGRQIDAVTDEIAKLKAELDRHQNMLNELISAHLYASRADVEGAVHRAMAMLNGTKWEIG